MPHEPQITLPQCLQWWRRCRTLNVFEHVEHACQPCCFSGVHIFGNRGPKEGDFSFQRAKRVAYLCALVRLPLRPPVCLLGGGWKHVRGAYADAASPAPPGAFSSSLPHGLGFLRRRPVGAHHNPKAAVRAQTHAECHRALSHGKHSPRLPPPLLSARLSNGPPLPPTKSFIGR